MQNITSFAPEKKSPTSERWLIAAFSRSGQTLRAARQLSEMLPSDLIEIRCPRSYSAAPFGFFRALSDTVLDRRLPHELDGPTPDCRHYQGVILASPIWASSLPPQVQGFLEAHARDIKNLGALLTCGGSGEKRALAKIETLAHRQPLASLVLQEKELSEGIKNPELLERFRNYIASLGQPSLQQVA